ncbi:MAG: heavy metal translocating P-type ATPase [Lachnospiraceae bacterium]|nr:heavy metal translocating P-type ATPase [Lachnospiraceae bacterium]MEE3436964.1 heavy metal translocating P-type ATPase [Lachnospiraceae bacterium]MEE3457093.1 heavy metal translocating P-type ATPase [Lachnospiraceae bacterium]
MKFRILHEAKGRLRVHAERPRISIGEADILEYYLKSRPGVLDVRVFERTGDAIIRYTCGREELLSALSVFSFSENESLVPEHTSRALNHEYQDRLFWVISRRLFRRFLVPFPVRRVMAGIRAFRYVREGVRCLAKGRLEVPVLDAAAITAAMLRGDVNTASSVMFLLKIGDILEEWTHKKSVADLASTLSLNVDKVWAVKDGTEVLVPVRSMEVGDEFVVRMGSMIPLDGVVVSGEAMINQASITGESMPVRKTEGAYIYAGTVVDEGEICVRTAKISGTGRYDRIAQMIEVSEKLKSASESRASHLADRLVPYSFGGTVLTWLLTRNITRTMSILMVDFSCALKLAMPLSFLAAMREAGKHGITVKGGKFLEAVASADTVIFDKTGTLTYASPRVAKVITFDGCDENEMLRLAACLEEHYPHSMANAVVDEAQRRGLIHEERHSKVEYIVAHGIASMVTGDKVVIGSRHFVLEDEGAAVPDDADIDALPAEYSHLYLAIGGRLAAVICIEDPLRAEAADVVKKLHVLGITKVCMMTGDNERTARAIADSVGVDEYHAEVLPEDKAAFVRAEHEAGRKVIMVGDGVNDSPALSEADAGIAIAEGAAIAREVADITVSSEDLTMLLTLRELSLLLMRRIDRNYRFIIGFNLGLILLGAFGVIPPTTSALLHNSSTILLSLDSMRDLLQ